MKKINKNLRCFLITSVTSLMLFSCSDGGKVANGPSFYPYKESANDKWGLADAYGEVLISDEFKDNITVSYNEMFFAETENGYDMYSIKNPSKPVGDKYLNIAYFLDDITPSVKRTEGIKYIDKKGNIKFELPLEYRNAKVFIHGASLIQKEDGQGCIVNKKGEIYAPSKYTIVDIVGNKKYLAARIDSDNPKQYYLIDENEKELKKLKTDFCSFSPNLKYYIYEDSGEFGIRKTENDEIVLRAKYKSLGFIDDELIATQNNDGYGIYTIDGDVKIKNKYSAIAGYRNGLFIARRDSRDGYGLLNMDEERILKFEYSLMKFIPGSSSILARKQNDRSIYILNDKGEEIAENAVFFDDPYSEAKFLDTKNQELFKLPHMYVVSDYYNVDKVLGSVLGFENKSPNDLYGFENISPIDFQKQINQQLYYNQIEKNDGLEWTPWMYANGFENGSLSYSLGFTELFTAEDVFGFYTSYELSAQGKCVAIRMRVDFDSEADNHIDIIQRNIENFISSAGFTNVSNSDNGLKEFYNNKHTLQYVFTDSWQSDLEIIISEKQ